MQCWHLAHVSEVLSKNGREILRQADLPDGSKEPFGLRVTPAHQPEPLFKPARRLMR